MTGAIKDMMTRNVTCIEIDMPFTKACKLFTNLHFHHFPVKDKKGQLVGMFSSTDAIYALNNKLVEHNVSSDDDINDLIKVEDVMTSKPLYTLDIDASIDDVVDMFQRQRIHSILILKEQKLVGIITSNDLLSAFRDHIE